MKLLRSAKWLSWLIPIFFMWACGGGSGGSSHSTGTLSLSLVDSPGDYQAVYVTIQEVQVCMQTGLCEGEGEAQECDCKWETVATLNQTYNLLELVNGVMAGLGQKDLEAGTYNQMRLLLGTEQEQDRNLLNNQHPYPQYLIDASGVERPIKVPSGYQTGIKLVHPFEIVAGLTTELILDFDVARSVIKAGNSGKYLLKPTIKVIGTHNRAVVSGVVTDDETADPIAGAVVTAYQEVEGKWSTAMGTVTDVSGAYMLYLDLGGIYELDPKEYKIVAVADDYEPACTTVLAKVDQIYSDTDLALTRIEMVTVEGTLTGTVAKSEGEVYPESGPVITVSFSRQGENCFNEPIETASVNITYDADAPTKDFYYDSETGSFRYPYSISLPTGTYDITASGNGLTPQEESNVVVDVPGPVELNFSF